jgi:hypothetical protein
VLNLVAFGCGSDQKEQPVVDASDASVSNGAIDQTLLGSSCTSDSDCGDQGLGCADEKDDAIYGGHAAGGICTMACTGADDSSCLAFGGLCENVSSEVDFPVWRCLQLCEPGGATTDSSKCHGRVDLACVSLDLELDFGIDNFGLCYPVCNADSNCGSERICHPRWGVCRAGDASGDAFGAPCTPEDDNCAGSCVGYEDDAGNFAYGYCSQACALGVEGSCPLSGGAAADCRFASSLTAGPGDYAYCQPTCSTDTDCGVLPADEDLYCNLSLVAILGHGLCEWGTPPVFPDAGIDAGTMDAENSDASVN